MPNISKHQKIKICNQCEGKGFTQREELLDHHKREYMTIRNKCSFCNGSGRSVEITTTEITGYTPEEIEK